MGYSREAMRIFPMAELFDGARLELKKPINMAPQFVTSHTVVMGQTTGGGAEDGSEQYMFGASYVSQDGSMALISKMDTMGILRAHIIKQWSPAFVSKIQGRVSSTPGETVLNIDLDHKGDDYAAQFKLVNDQALFFNYMQKVTPELAFGAQLDYYRARMHSIISIAARYATMNWVATAKANSDNALTVNYMHKVNDSFSMATQLDFNANSRDSSFKVGYEYLLQSGKFRGQVDSAGKIGMCVQESLIFGIMLQLCGIVDHKKQVFKFGIGLTIGG